MGIFNLQKRAKAKAPSQIGITPITLNTPGILAGSGYHLLTDAPEVAAAIGIIAGLISSMPIHLMENRENGDVRVRDQLARKIDIDPWSLGTRQTWIHWIVEKMLTEGEAVVIPKTAGNLIGDLIPAPDAYVARDYGSPSYYAMYAGQKFPAEDILHFRFRPDPSYPWKGIGLQTSLQRVVDSIITTAETKTAYMSSEYKPPIIVAVNSDSDLSNEKNRKAFADAYLKQAEKGAPWILPADMVTVQQAKPLSLTDLAIKDGVELDKKTVATIFGIPAFLLGVGSFNREEYNTFISRTLMPICRGIEQELTKKLLYSESRYFRFNSRALYSYSLQELSTIARDLRAAGMMTGNEGRNWIDLPPMAGLDELVMLENYVPADLLGSQKKLNTTQTEEE